MSTSTPSLANRFGTVRAALGLGVCVCTLSLVAASCPQPSLLAEGLEARRRVASLEAQFARAVEASQRAVMAADEQASTRFKEEAEALRAQVGRDTKELEQLLQRAELGDEEGLLARFRSNFTAYEVLDRNILGLADEKTNFQAQRLSSGPAREAADAFARALDQVVASVPESARWQARALALKALVSVREIQVLEAPHIREPDDLPMARMEQQMAASARGAREALDALDALERPVPNATGSTVAAASEALDRFEELHAEIVSLSRRNTNVRSRALTLKDKRTLTAACEESLRALQAALAKRIMPASR